ncbi:terpenoid cyclases/Protein prenyltransferase [Hesseltinella vesiculosa]|uniref:Protein farnesyltransferase subunit beta n=1 Tax=Hesseltinella vesiculosa TaxID=101127 RepID=A0A1X2GNZ8_9FUNG|nr:terpenoid cyclases/Protein prenyltransferase [Hesseltinella vesiculosa]
MGILNGQVTLQQLRCNDDGLPTESSIVQKRTEDTVLESFVPFAPHHPERQPLESVRLHRDRHIQYLLRGLEQLGQYMVVLDASRPWLMYWILHSLDLLGHRLDAATVERGIATLAACQHADGGFGGGPAQLAHLATTYAAVNTLAILGTKEAYETIDRPALQSFLMRMKQPDGSFTMHDGGETDIRGSYCALSVATLANLLTPDLTAHCGDFIVRSQTFEGGIGPYPGIEAHNGYTFCGVAAIEILGEMHRLNMDKFTKWCCERQMQLEGGFQGRTNKLVDGCYSFWGSGDFPLIHAEWRRQRASQDDYLLDREALQEYQLLCCQADRGGLIDKPGKFPDYYHTCYGLSGLSTAQHLVQRDETKAQQLETSGQQATGGLGSLLWTYANDFTIVGDMENLLTPTHPIHNISLVKARKMIHYFYAFSDTVLALLPEDEEPCLES